MSTRLKRGGLTELQQEVMQKRSFILNNGDFLLGQLNFCVFGVKFFFSSSFLTKYIPDEGKELTVQNIDNDIKNAMKGFSCLNKIWNSSCLSGLILLFTIIILISVKYLFLK